MAFLVRMRILHSTLEAITAEGSECLRLGRKRRKAQTVVRPPAASACATSASEHCLANSKSCTRCRGSAYLATRASWIFTPCVSLINVDGTLLRPPPGHRVHISGDRCMAHAQCIASCGYPALVLPFVRALCFATVV
eukprot:602904-Pyramimonas_sp.AAC.1